MVWCLSPCGGSITGSLVWHYPFVLRVNISGGLSSLSIFFFFCGALVVSVGRNQECVPACCTILRYSYMNYLLETSSCVIDGNHPTTIRKSYKAASYDYSANVRS